MKVIDTPEILLIDSTLQSDMFNILCCQNAALDLVQLNKSIAYFREKERPYTFWIGFEDEPSWLERELLSLGLVTEEIE